MKTEQIIEQAGGVKLLAYKLNVHQLTVERWFKRGIPAKYWSSIIQLSRGTVTAKNLLANVK